MLTTNDIANYKLLMLTINNKYLHTYLLTIMYWEKGNVKGNLCYCSFSAAVAHGIHSLYLEHLRHFFEPNAGIQ